MALSLFITTAIEECSAPAFGTSKISLPIRSFIIGITYCNDQHLAGLVLACLSVRECVCFGGVLENALSCARLIIAIATQNRGQFLSQRLQRGLVNPPLHKNFQLPVDIGQY